MIAEFLTAGGIILTGLGLLYNARQLRMSRYIAHSEFLLHFYELVQQYNDIHARLTGDGPWAQGRGGPATEEEWSRVNRYMGLLEIIQVMLEADLLDRRTMDRLYSHRIAALVDNPVIHQTNLVEKAYRWRDFIALWKGLEREAAFSALIAHERLTERVQPQA